MEIEARLRDNKVTILIEDLDLSNLANLTEQTVKECVRPLIESHARLNGVRKTDAKEISYRACYGTRTPPSDSDEVKIELK